MGRHRPWPEIKKDLEDLMNEMNSKEVSMSFKIVMERASEIRKKENEQTTKKKRG